MTDDRGPAGQLWPDLPARLGTWTRQQEEDFELARATLNALIAIYTARLAATDDAAVAERLGAAQARYTAERRALLVTDDATVQRILRQYPSLLRRLREGMDV